MKARIHVLQRVGHLRADHLVARCILSDSPAGVFLGRIQADEIHPINRRRRRRGNPPGIKPTDLVRQPKEAQVIVRLAQAELLADPLSLARIDQRPVHQLHLGVALRRVKIIQPGPGRPADNLIRRMLLDIPRAHPRRLGHLKHRVHLQKIVRIHRRQKIPDFSLRQIERADARGIRIPPAGENVGVVVQILPQRHQRSRRPADERSRRIQRSVIGIFVINPRRLGPSAREIRQRDRHRVGWHHAVRIGVVNRRVFKGGDAGQICRRRRIAQIRLAQSINRQNEHVLIRRSRRRCPPCPKHCDSNG